MNDRNKVTINEREYYLEANEILDQLLTLYPQDIPIYQEQVDKFCNNTEEPIYITIQIRRNPKLLEWNDNIFIEDHPIMAITAITHKIRD